MTMRKEIRLPELGEDAGDEAKVSFWYAEEGESVDEGADLVEMLTDKATFNVPSPETGQIVEVKVGEGDVVKVGDVIAVMETEA
jgi:pyruvate/2-oxoglutarate dehydrogenase complex dihydrolipoamide acyltransferase (E2) component